ncbi:MAG: VWA domain-containing protein [Calditrichaeota bacterium]|nr:VWA domain-containing protein [Calditrichota bacterium]
MLNSAFRFSSAYPFWLIVIGIILSAAFSIWVYRRTVPPVRRWLRYGLIFLRWSAFSLAIIFLSQLEINQYRIVSEPAKILVIMDKSASMNLAKGESDSLNPIRELFGSDEYKRLNDEYNTRLFSFSDSLENEWSSAEALLDSPNAGVGTDLGRAWMQAFEQYGIDLPATVLLITDGAHNKGADPARLARLARVPIQAIGVGSPEASLDLMIRSVSVNPVVYQGSQVPVEVGYRAVGVAGKTVSITLLDQAGASVGSQTVRVSDDFTEGSLRFEIAVDTSGRHRYTVRIKRFENELTFDNNRRSFYLNVLANRMAVLIMAGPPDPGLGDLVRRLKNDEQVEVVQRTTRGARFYEGQWPSEELLSRTDVVILHHFPVRSNRKNAVEAFVKQLTDMNIPVGFIDGGQVDLSRFRMLEPLLPLKALTGRLRIIRGQVTPVRRHAVIAEPDETDINRGWSDLPPVMLSAHRFQVKPQTQILAEFRDENSNATYPAVVVFETGGMKSAALMMRDLWRWGLSDTGDDGILEPMLQRMIRWLAVRKVDKRVKLVFDRELFSIQEQVGFTVTVLDENYTPLDGVDVSADISLNREPGGRAELTGIGNGRYRGSFRAWSDGEYQVTVKAQLNDMVIGQDRGKITVEQFSIELLDAHLNEDLLKAVGEASRGGYVKIDRADSLFRTLDFKPVEREEKRVFQFYGKAWLLIVIIGLLALEWFIRIRMGML